jgi:hypothetical protein
LGEVHLLPFDASSAEVVEDEWVRLVMQSMVRHAWDRRAYVVSRLEQSGPDSGGYYTADAVRRQLDPNEGVRWVVVVATLFLLVYAVVAGPVNFSLASRHGKPLRALLWLPVFSALALSAIVLLGMAAKGTTGRARRLTLLEVGAGLSRGLAVRFRGFYSASAEDLMVRVTERGNVLDVVDDSGLGRSIIVDRDGLRLEDFRSRPWQTLVVQENGLLSMPGDISISRDTGGDVVVRNRSGRALLGVVLSVPRQNARYFSRVADGELVRASDGASVTVRGGPGARLGLEDVSTHLDSSAAGLVAAWAAIEGISDARAEWWATDVPVLLAQLEGGEGRTSDSGMRVELDRVLVRVVGWGGTP